MSFYNLFGPLAGNFGHTRDRDWGGEIGTIIWSIHQPVYGFYLFSNVILMVVYSCFKRFKNSALQMCFCSIYSAPWQGTFVTLGMGMGGEK